MLQGVYQFELDVMDNHGATGSATVQVMVYAANIAPTANAGSDQLITLPVNTVNLSGDGVDPDGTLSSYNWIQLSGPPVTITNPSSEVAIVTGLAQGVYQFELDVEDNDGAIGRDTMQVTVNAPPISNAGADQLINLPANNVNLTGTRNRRRWNDSFIQLDKDIRPFIRV